MSTAQSNTSNTRWSWYMVLGFGVGTGCLIVAALALMALGYLPKFSIKQRVTILPAPPVTLLAPQQFAQTNLNLAQSVADLNVAEQNFLQAAQANAPIDMALQEIAARAMVVSVNASQLGNTAASQDSASAAALQSASGYFSVSRYAAALVIVAQNARTDLTWGRVTHAQAAAQIAEYSSRLSNPLAGTDSALLQFIATDQITNQLGGAPQFWLASSADMVSVKLTVPNPSASFSKIESLALMTTIAGQADADAARLLAKQIIEAGGNTNIPLSAPTGGEVTAMFASAFAVSTNASAVPVFANGSANAITSTASKDIISTLIALGADGTPSIAAQTTLLDVKPVVTLTISNLVVKQINQRPKDALNTFEADVSYEFDVQWQSSLTHPQFNLDCVSGNHFEITTTSGVQHISAKGLLILFPGAEDAYCYAARNGATLGSASVHFLVGEPAAATQRALQVETDSVSLDITLTADALGTRGAQLNNAAATLSVAGTENALSTEVYGTQNAEFLQTVTAIARQTQLAVPLVTDTPLPTATFTPVLVENLYLRGDQAALSTSKKLQLNRLYQFCFSGIVYLDTGGVEAYELMHVNGIAVPVSGCMTIAGTGAVAVITCGHGTSAEDPGGYSIQVIDLGPW